MFLHKLALFLILLLISDSAYRFSTTVATCVKVTALKDPEHWNNDANLLLY